MQTMSGLMPAATWFAKSLHKALPTFLRNKAHPPHCSASQPNEENIQFHEIRSVLFWFLSGCIQQRLELVDGVAELLSAEFGED